MLPAAAAAAMMLAAAACAHGRRAGAPVAMPAPQPPPPASVTVDPLRICVVKDGRMEYVTGRYDSATGDTLVEGRRVHEAYPLTAAYASGTDWFARDYNLSYNGLYFRYGLPRTLLPGDVVPVGAFRGITVFAEPSDSRRVVIYLPVDPFCTFQAYEREERSGAVRG